MTASDTLIIYGGFLNRSIEEFFKEHTDAAKSFSFNDVKIKFCRKNP